MITICKLLGLPYEAVEKMGAARVVYLAILTFSDEETLEKIRVAIDLDSGLHEIDKDLFRLHIIQKKTAAIVWKDRDILKSTVDMVAKELNIPTK